MNDKITKEEILKWLNKLPDVNSINAKSEKAKEWLVNMKAYISDSKHFMDKGDLVRSFEAMLWASLIYELMIDLGEFGEK